MKSRSAETPMMRQFLSLKAKVPDALLFFRMGDFYELFLEDAEVAAPLLDLVLTSRDKDAENPIPMCGIPFHAAEGYIRRLLEAGHRVAIGEQVEDPKLAKGLVKREVVEVISPGIVADASRLSGAEANYVGAIYREGMQYGLAYLDASTGEFRATGTDSPAVLAAELARVAPRELLVREADKDLIERLPASIVPRKVHADDFEPKAVIERVGRELHGLDAGAAQAEHRAAAAVFATVAAFQPAALASVEELRIYRAADRMLLDPSTRSHLELLRNTRDGTERGSLLETLDQTRTPMGRRELIHRIGEPLLDPDAIRARQDDVARWIESDLERRNLRDALRRVGDLERCLTRVLLPHVAPRELATLRTALLGVEGVHERVGLPGELMASVQGVARSLLASLVEEPPTPPRGEPYVGYICDGVDSEVDRIRSEAEQGDAYLAELEARERETLGIKGLRVRYNRVFGYSIEVSKAHASKVPEHYRRKQTTANAERYTTEELLHWEGVVLRSREAAATAEAQVLAKLQREVAAAQREIREVARQVARLDVAQSLAEVARTLDYVRPTLDDSRELRVVAGRHPVAERYTAEGFIANDVHVDASGIGFLILTGPNMAGKSTLLRQLGLIVLLAQMGAWVPAQSAHIGIVDRIFTRVGASDSLLTGESTFMVEMRETSSILAEATDRSLVLLDEIGRGTSTFDGLSIAWAVSEYLHDTPGLRPRTLFATHYHELADLAQTRPGVRNYHFACAERGGEILFLRKMEPGAASRSYGIEVARHAGLPPAVVRRAREVLRNLEGGEFDERGRPRLARQPGTKGAQPAQLGLFENARDPLRDALRELDPDQLTPVAALLELVRLKRQLEDER